MSWLRANPLLIFALLGALLGVLRQGGSVLYFPHHHGEHESHAHIWHDHAPLTPLEEDGHHPPGTPCHIHLPDCQPATPRAARTTTTAASIDTDLIPVTLSIVTAVALPQCPRVTPAPPRPPWAPHDAPGLSTTRLLI